MANDAFQKFKSTFNRGVTTISVHSLALVEQEKQLRFEKASNIIRK